MCNRDRCQRGVSDAEANLQQVLVAMRKLLRLPRLEYVSIQNQADFLIEVPVEMSDVPKVSSPPRLLCFILYGAATCCMGWRHACSQSLPLVFTMHVEVLYIAVFDKDTSCA